LSDAIYVRNFERSAVLGGRIMDRTVVLSVKTLAIGFSVALLLLVVNVALFVRAHKLSEIAQQMYNQLRPVVGLPFPRIHGLTHSGTLLDLDTSNLGGNQLLLVLAPACSACEENWPTWEHLVSHDKKMRTLYIDLPGNAGPEYLYKHHLDAERVLTGLDPKLQIALNIRATPTTIILDRHGRILNSWMGVMSKDDEAQALSWLDRD
jgi:hypothetical protein